MKKLRVAIVSDVVMKYGGAEKVLESMLQLFPTAVLYTLFIVPAARKKLNKLYPGVEVRTSLWQFLIWSDKISKYISVIKVFSWIYWERLDLSSYDLVVSSSHSFMSKNVRTNRETFHLSYVHTPPRYLYDEFNEIGIINRFPVSVFFWPIKVALRLIDMQGSRRPDVLVANSKNVQSRIKKYYKRDSKLIYPPVDDPDFKVKSSPIHGDYYVWISRLVNQKGIYTAVETCEEMGRKLIVVGGGEEYNSLVSKNYKWVTFAGECNDQMKYQILGSAKALLYTSIDEDFGIVPVEALKMGIPVIAPKTGGVSEVVFDSLNGVIYDESVKNSLESAILRFENIKISITKCRQSVLKFGQKKFQQQIQELIDMHDVRKN